MRVSFPFRIVAADLCEKDCISVFEIITGRYVIEIYEIVETWRLVKLRA